MQSTSLFPGQALTLPRIEFVSGGHTFGTQLKHGAPTIAESNGIDFLEPKIAFHGLSTSRDFGETLFLITAFNEFHPIESLSLILIVPSLSGNELSAEASFHHSQCARSNPRGALQKMAYKPGM